MHAASKAGQVFARPGSLWCGLNQGYTVLASSREDELLVYDSLDLARRMAVRGPTWLSGSQIWLSAEDEDVAHVLANEAMTSTATTATHPSSSVRETSDLRLVTSASVPSEIADLVWTSLRATTSESPAPDQDDPLEIRLGVLYGDLTDGTAQHGPVVPMLFQGSGVACGPLLDVERGTACVTCMTMREAAGISELLELDQPVFPGRLATGTAKPDVALAVLLASTVCAFVSQIASARHTPHRSTLTEIVRIDYLDWQLRRANAFPLLHCPACGMGRDVDYGWST